MAKTVLAECRYVEVEGERIRMRLTVEVTEEVEVADGVPEGKDQGEMLGRKSEQLGLTAERWQDEMAKMLIVEGKVQVRDLRFGG
jgi:hypothetical protein